MAKFVNTYNFVPFGYVTEKQRTSREHVYRGENSLISGWLTVKLDTKTPLIIPDGAHPKYYDCKEQRYISRPSEELKRFLHKEYSFLQIPSLKNPSVSEPIIPGSELRGMIRSIYETVTDSCIPFLLDDKRISQRVPTFGSLRKRGLLAYEPITEGSDERHWVLYSAYADKEKAVYVREDKINPIRDENGNILPKNGTYVKNRGWLQYNIPVRKDDYHIAYLTKNSVVFSWDYCDEHGNRDQKRNEEPYEALKTALFKDRKEDGKVDKNEAKNANKIPRNNLYDALERAKKGGDNLVPVYYFTVQRGEETLVYLSNSSIGRIAQRRKWKDIMGDHAPCSSTDKLCPACLLFGTVEDKGLKGRVRFTDAAMTTAPEFETHTLQILGQPRTSAFEFYLRKPEEKATYWNFDFYGIKVADEKQNGRNRNPNNKDNSHTEYYDLGESTPRGRKMYWHHPLAPEAEKNRMNSTMEAVNGSFEFKVYFDEVTEEQLQNLIWVITLGENNPDSARQHKLGHAKPLGYGSVKMVVTEKVIRQLKASDDGLNINLKKTSVAETVECPFKETDDIIRNLLKMCDASAIPDNVPVTYPYKDGSDKIFEWFSDNRKNPDSLKTLPEPLDKDITLTDCLVRNKSGRNQSWKGSNYQENKNRGNQINRKRESIYDEKAVQEAKKAEDPVKFAKPKPIIDLKPGTEYEGEVKQLKSGMKIADIYCSTINKTINLKAGNVIFCDEKTKKLDNVFTKGDKVRVRYCGIDENGKQSWLCIKNRTKNLPEE